MVLIIEMKTIKELNSKAWYRILKVIYVLAFLLSIIGVGGLFYTFYPKVSYSGSTYKYSCNKVDYTAGNLKYSDLNASYYSSDYEEVKLKKKLLRAVCALEYWTYGDNLKEYYKGKDFESNADELFAIFMKLKASQEDNMPGFIKSLEDLEYLEEYANTNNSGDYTISIKEKVYVYSIEETSLAYIGGLAWLIFFYFAPKHTFYYIVLGKLNPKE